MAATISHRSPKPLCERYHGNFALLDTPEGKQALAEAIIEHGSIKRGCDVLGIPHPTLFCRLHEDAELMGIVRAARATAVEKDIESLKDIEDELYFGRPDATGKLVPPDRDRISALREVMRGMQWRVGKCNPAVYGDKPGTTVNVSTQLGVVCDEATRRRLIELRQSLTPTALTEGTVGRPNNTVTDASFEPVIDGDVS